MGKVTDRSRFTPDGWHAVTPRIVVRDAQRCVDFIRHVFGATGDFREDTPAILKLGDSTVMVSEAGVRHASPAFLYVYVGNADETYRRAVAAGARSLEAPWDLPYGDRRGMVEDTWGNTWQIATHLKHQPTEPLHPTRARNRSDSGGRRGAAGAAGQRRRKD
jgi:uncharacterized glyoxalase superfamily protein PhnB